MFKLWLVYRYIRGSHRLVNLTSILAVLGMILAVASLFVSMAVVSGFYSTLKASVISVTSHVMLTKSGSLIRNPEEVQKEVKSIIGADFKAMSPYVALEAVLGHHKKLSGVLIEGVDESSMDQVIDLKSRLIRGEFKLSNNESGIPGAVIGVSVAEKFSLKLGDEFRIVIPKSEEYDRAKIRPKLQKFVLRGVLDLGREDFNSRYIITSLKAAQKFGNYGDGVSGYWIKLTSPDQARTAVYKLLENTQGRFWVRDWKDINRNLFEAVELEKVVIFFILLILVVAASVNVISTLFVNVLRRFPDIGILKAIGANRRFIVQVFLGIGAFIGTIGVLGGFALGYLACFVFEWLEDSFGLIRSEVYKLTRIEVDILFSDLAMIFIASIIICLLATLAPAIRGARLAPVEGLKYE